MIVAKFGGSSIRDASAFARCLAIIQKFEYRIVVVSATYNTTNELEDLYEHYSDLKVDAILERHLNLAKDLGLNQENVYAYLRKIRDKLISRPKRDEMLAQGELISSFLMASYLRTKLAYNVDLFDIRDFMVTTNEPGKAKPVFDEVEKNASKLASVDSSHLIVTQGFIGRSFNKETTTLGREGSDYSATILARYLLAKEVHIWTDVDGVYNCDPKMNKNAYSIKKLSYDQAELMAMNGAKVLFPQTLSPLKSHGIKLWVKSSLDSNKVGTCIGPFETSETAICIQESKIIILGPHSVSENYHFLKKEKNYSVIQVQNSELDLKEIYREVFSH